MKADKTLITWLLYESGVSRYQIWKDTGILQTTLSDLTTGKNSVDKMQLKNAAALTEYAKKVKKEIEPMITMKDLTITQEAYLSGTNDEPYYEGTGEDKDGNTYSIRWDILDDYDPAGQGEDMACDWDDPSKITEIK